MIGLVRRVGWRSAAPAILAALVLTNFAAPAWAMHPPPGIVTANQAGNTVEVHALDGAHQHTFMVNSNGLSGIGVAANGTIGVADSGNNRVQLLDPNNGNLQGQISVQGPPADVVFALDGNSLFVAKAGANAVEQYSVSGSHMQTLTGPFDTPIRLAVGPNNHLYVGQAGNADNVLEFDLNSSAFPFIGTFSGSGSAPGQSNDISGLGLNPDGTRLNTVDQQGARVQIYKTDDRSFVYGFGSFGSQPQQLFFPSGIVQVEDRFYVGSAGMDLIKVYDLPGNHLFNINSPNPIDLGLLQAAPKCRADMELTELRIFRAGPIFFREPLSALETNQKHLVEVTYQNNGEDPVQVVAVVVNNDVGAPPLSIPAFEGGIQKDQGFTSSSPPFEVPTAGKGTIEATVLGDCADPKPDNNTKRLPITVGPAARSRLRDEVIDRELTAVTFAVQANPPPLPPPPPPKAASNAASPRDVTKVELALMRTEGKAKAAARRARCHWLKNAKSRFKASKPEGGRCTKPIWLRAKKAKGNRWTLKLPRGVPAGKYVLYARSTTRQSVVESDFSAKRGNRRAFKVRKR